MGLAIAAIVAGTDHDQSDLETLGSAGVVIAACGDNQRKRQ
jgi:hypothetical protein